MRIIYNNDSGGVTVIVPSPEALEIFGIEAIAIKDVPAGKPFKIIPDSAIPADRSHRAAWAVDPAILTDGVGGESNQFQEAA